MQESISSGIAVSYITIIIFYVMLQDHICRKVKDTLNKICERNKIKMVCLDTKATWKAPSLLSIYAQGENAEVIITKGSILCFSYYSFCGYRIYSQIRHWHLDEEKVISSQINRSVPIKSLSIKDGNLVINSLVKHVNMKSTIKDVTKSGKTKIITKMLNISNTH